MKRFRLDLGARRRRFAVTSLGIVALSLGLSALAEEPPAEGPPPAEAEEVFTEQSIYIPYAKLRAIFEKEGRGVFLPYEEFQELWKAARENTRPPVEAKPPIDALITESQNEATVSEDVVRVSSRLKIELLAEGWNEIPLRLGGAAITQAMLGDEPARIVFDPGTGHKLLIEQKDRQARLVELSLEYVKAFAKTPGRNSVSFDAPQALVSRWRIRIPEAGVKVSVQPLIAATEVPEDDQADAGADQTVVLAFVGAAPTVRIDWTPKAEGARGLEALANVQSEQQVTIDEGVTRTRTRLTYDISRAELSRLLVEVPGDQKIVNVFDANIRQWSVEQVDDGQRVTAELFEPAKLSQSVTIELERFTGDEKQTELTVPVVRAVGTGRQQGVVVVEVAAGLRAEATKHTGLLQVDAAELPAGLAQRTWAFSYRYVSLPFDLALRVDKVEPRITAESLVEATLEPDELTLNTVILCNVEQAGVFRLDLDIPAGYDVRHVSGQVVSGAQPVEVDGHYLEGDDKTHLVVNLSRKAFGKVALAVRLHRRLAEPDLLTPTGRAVDLRLEVPRMTAGTVERASGRLLVRAPESLRVNPGADVEGMRSVSFTEAVQGLGFLRTDSSSGARPVLAYAYAQEDVSLPLVVERRKPHVTARQLLTMRVDAGVVKYEASFFYDVKYSGVQSLRIDVPAALAGEIRNQTAGIRDKEIDPQPEDVPEGYVAWSLAGETEFLGGVNILLAWEEKIEELEVGKSIERDIPCLRPMDVDRAWGQIVLAKAETIDVQATGTPQGVRPIDPQHDLMPGAKVEGGALAFEFHDDWSLEVTATRYQLEEVKRTSIERAVLQMVVTRGGQVSVQALYRMRSAQQRMAVRLPESVAFDSEPLRINGRAVPLERGDQQDFFVPLAGQDADKPFLLELRYTMSGMGTRLECPVFPAEPAVQKVYICAYLPEELAYLGSTGPWTDELVWRRQPVLDFVPRPRDSAGSLANWVIQGLGVPGNPATTFHTDGRMYMFSTLQPPSGAAGALRLFTLDEDWLSVLVLLPVVVVGLVLLRAGASVRWLAGGAFVVLLVLAGVFLPTFVRQVVDNRLLCAVLIVLVVWLLQYVVWTRSRVRVVATPEQARAEAALARSKAGVEAAPPAETAEPPPEPDIAEADSEATDEDPKEGGGDDA